MNKYGVVFLILLCFLCSCSSKWNQQEAVARQEVRDFFISHPEYTESQEKETLLYTIFEAEIKKTDNENKSLLQLLEASHEKLRVLVTFEEEK